MIWTGRNRDFHSNLKLTFYEMYDRMVGPRADSVVAYFVNAVQFKLSTSFDSRCSLVSSLLSFRRATTIQTTGQTSPAKRNMKNYFFNDFFSPDFWQKF